MSTTQSYKPFNRLEFKANEYITLKLENNRTFIYVKGRRFLQCIRLVLNINQDSMEVYDEIGSIDEAAEVYKNTLHQNRIVTGPMARPTRNQEHDISAEQEFWGHCSNIQAWIENNYNTRILYRNMAFPLLKELMRAGDPKAKKVFKEEIAIRLESGYPNVLTFLQKEGYLHHLAKEELVSVIDSPDFIKNLINNAKQYRDLIFLETLLRYIEPKYFKYDRKFNMRKTYYENAPDLIDCFGNLLYQLLVSRKFTHLGKSIMNYGSLGIAINFAMDKKEYKKSSEMCKAILDLYPESPGVWNSLAFSLATLGEYNNALEACKKSLKHANYLNVAPENAISWNVSVSWNNMGWIYNYLGEYSKAIESCEQAIELKPEFANPYNHLGFAHFRMGNKEEGIALMKKSHTMNPHYCRALSNLGLVFYEMKKYEESYDNIHKCMKTDVRFKEAHNVFRKLITDPKLKDLSLKYHNHDREFSESFLKFLQWLRKKCDLGF
ncbi:MAG: tetratricopeptide repeat protein [Promethearchaeota archaeon]|jgi:tetratricopeptide (TPR) repeat protein